ncbi:hypothetical protein D3C75_743170 [compost metagenome]
MQLGKGLKQLGLLLGRNADSCILYTKFQSELAPVRAELRPYSNRNMPRLGKLNSIADQVNHHLAQPGCIPHNQLRYIRGNPAAQPDVFFLGFGQEQLGDTIYDPFQA